MRRLHEKPWSQGKPLGPHELVAAHMEFCCRRDTATQRRDYWVSECQRLSEAGKLEAARKALKKADWWEFQRRKWDMERRELEPRTAGRNPAC